MHGSNDFRENRKLVYLLTADRAKYGLRTLAVIEVAIRSN